MTRRYVVTIDLLVDNDDLAWWQALSLPDPATWSLSDTFTASVFPKIALEVEAKR